AGPNSIFDSFSGVRHVPLIALLGEDNPEIEIKCLSAGADDCLPASSDYRVLGAHMQALIRRYGLARSVRRQKPLRIGPVVLDPARWTAESGGMPLKLTPKEFAVLELLMRKKGGIVLRSALMDRIRRSFEESSSHTLETHISNLRSKLGRSCSCRIKSVAGVGYILSAGHAGKRKTKR
ncbi:MAG: response regulator transcription factor, partial [Elusimicrobia bacterium]|nr:response regulator transcription factor [Elusimicrobiota bacterium]